MQSFIEFIEKHYPDVLPTYLRATTPYYYEPETIYKNISNGFGGQGITRKMKIVSGEYNKDGDIFMNLVSIDDPSLKFGVLLSEAPWKLVREIEEKPRNIPISNDKSRLYITVNDEEYLVIQRYFRSSKGELGGRVFVSKVGNIGHYHYWQLYSNFKSIWHLKTVTGKDSSGREVEEIKFNISVRQFKEIVFGNPFVKFTHKSIEELSEFAQNNVLSLE